MATTGLVASGKTLAWLGAPHHTWHFLFPLISPLWIPSPLISHLWISSPWGRSSGHLMHPRPLYLSHTPFPFLMYVYQVGLFPLICRTSCTLCFLSFSLRPPESLTVTFLFYFVYYLFFCPGLAHDVSLGLFFAPLRVSFTPLFVF